jgi:hypothetical protein
MKRIPHSDLLVALGCSRQLALDTSMNPLGGRRRPRSPVLALGAIPAAVLSGITARGLRVVVAANLADFITKLAGADFHAAVLEQEPLGILAIRTVKLSLETADLDAASLASATSRHRHTPFFLLPAEGEREFATVIAPPSMMFFSPLAEVPIEHAIATLDVGVLLRAEPS